MRSNDRLVAGEVEPSRRSTCKARHRLIFIASPEARRNVEGDFQRRVRLRFPSHLSISRPGFAICDGVVRPLSAAYLALPRSAAPGIVLSLTPQQRRAIVEAAQRACREGRPLLCSTWWPSLSDAQRKPASAGDRAHAADPQVALAGTGTERGPAEQCNSGTARTAVTSS
jgi:hypothetical protein